MSIPINFGIFKLFNVAYPSYFVTLISGNPTGTVSVLGYDPNCLNQQWKVVNVKNGDKFISIESNATTTTAYISAYINRDGVALAGSPNITVWSFNILDDTKGIVEIQTANSKFYWSLSPAREYNTIVLKPVRADGTKPGEEGQWKFEKISD